MTLPVGITDNGPRKTFPTFRVSFARIDGPFPTISRTAQRDGNEYLKPKTTFPSVFGEKVNTTPRYGYKA